MMEPQIQYVKTSDGVNIAYYAMGSGPATLFLMSPWSHLEAEWHFDLLRMRYTLWSQRCTLVRLDPRGHGLSDRHSHPFALNGMVMDIEAVADRLGLDKFRVLAAGLSSVAGLAYTAKHQDKVTHLALFPPASAWQDLDSQRLRRVMDLADVDWELGSETMIRTLYPDFADQQAKEFAALVRKSVDPSTFTRLPNDASTWNADEDAASLSTPTLLLHFPNNPNFDMTVTRRVAGLIKHSRVAFVDSTAQAAQTAQTWFDGEDPERTKRAPPSGRSPESSTFCTILFTDVEGSTALTQQLGDDKAREVLREHERITRVALKNHNGTEVKAMGDGFMTSFTSATSALECAIAMQKAFAEWNSGVGSQHAAPIQVRIGLNAGEPIAEDEDLFGTAVNMAARICSKANAGQILAAVVVRELVAGKGFLFSDIGETELRGFEDPVRLYELSGRD